MQSNWGFMIGDGSGYWEGGAGWGNAELECYTSDPSNVAIIADPSDSTNGLLSITALNQPSGYVCNNLQSASSIRSWTSARLWTHGKQSFVWPSSSSNNTTIRVEARIKIPMAQGTWPAFWSVE